MKTLNYQPLFIITILFSALFVSCEELRDPCEDKLCLNGGICNDGTCICANGYTGTNCQTAPPQPCEVNNTGVYCVENNSAAGKVYDILFNNVRYGVLRPGESECYTLTAGSHYLVFRVSNSSTVSCSGNVDVIRCATNGASCDT